MSKPPGKNRLAVWFVFLIVLAGVSAYHNSFSGVFLFDDSHAIVNNPAIRSLESFWRTADGSIASRPIVDFTFALNYALGGYTTWGYHFVNLAIHILAALILFALVRRTLECRNTARRAPTDPSQNSNTVLSFAVALIWLVHPLQTSSVTYLVQRTESLAGLFYLLTLYFSARGFFSDRPRTCEALAVFSCALGMGSKQMMATAPLLVFLYDRIFVSPSFKSIFRKRKFFYLSLALTWVILILLMPHGGNVTAGFAFKGISPLEYARSQAGVILHYLRLAFWPEPLVIDYDWPVSADWKSILIPSLLVASLVAATVWALKRKPEIGFLGAAFFIILAPSSSVIPIADLAFEHRMYLPLAPLIALSVFATYEISKRYLILSRTRRGISAGVLLFVVLVFSALTVRRNIDYQDTMRMWYDALRKRPANARIHDTIGFMLAKVGENEEALKHFLEAARINPNFSAYPNSAGMMFARLGRYEQAVSYYERSLRLEPNSAAARNNIGVAYWKLGNLEQAAAHFEHLLKIKPDDAEAHFHLGSVLHDEKRLDEALNQLAEAIRLRPNYAEARTRIGMIYFEKGDLQQARAAYEAVIRVSPAYAEAHNNLGVLLARIGEPDEAIRHFQEAIRLRPEDPSAKQNLEALLRSEDSLSRNLRDGSR